MMCLEPLLCDPCDDGVAALTLRDPFIPDVDDMNLPNLESSPNLPGSISASIFGTKISLCRLNINY